MLMNLPAIPSSREIVVIRDNPVRRAPVSNSPILNEEDKLEVPKGSRLFLISLKPNKGKYYKVVGKPVGLRGYSAYSFFAHKDLEDSNLWVISEVTTGCFIAKGNRIEEAITAAEIRLEGTNRYKFLAKLSTRAKIDPTLFQKYCQIL